MINVLNAFFLGTRRRALITGVLIFIALTSLDYMLSDEVSIDVFYFIPIFIVTWHGGRLWGVAISVACTIDWIGDTLFSAPAAYTSPQILLWNGLVRLASFLILVHLLAEFRTLLARERAASRLKSSMIHTVSHEFNNSLTSMSGGLYLLRETEPDEQDERRSSLYAMLSSAHQQLALYVKTILNDARMEEGKFKLEKKPVALRELALEASQAVGGLLKQKNISLSTKMPGCPILTNADPAALALVVSNLLSNAIKYTPQNGKISIEIRPSGEPPDRVIFSVEDTGIGISLEDLKKITTGFYRTEEGKASAAGFGLGLKISDELLRLHGSRLEISSEKGKGSEFFFELPALPPGKTAGN